MRKPPLWITPSLAVALACGCNSKEAAQTKPPESTPAAPTPVAPTAPAPTPSAGTVSADEMGTFTCKNIQNEQAEAGNSACVDMTDHFDAAAPVVHMTYRTPDMPKPGDVYVVQWIAEEVHGTTPPNSVIVTLDQPVKDVPADAKSYTVNSNLTKPTKGWPVGKYRIEVKLGGKLVTTAHFAIQ